MFFTNKCAIPLCYVLINVHAQSLLSNQTLLKLIGSERRGVGLLYSRGGMVCSPHCLNDSTLYNNPKHLHLLPNLTVIFLMFAIHPLTLRFYKALCHLMHYSTDLCPSACWPCLVSCTVGVLMQCKWMWWSSVRSDCPWFLCTWRCTRVYFLCPSLSFFYLKVKMYIALCCTGQCPKVNTFLIKMFVTWATSVYLVFLWLSIPLWTIKN